MAFKYTEDQLNKMDKTLIVELFLGLQDHMEKLTKETHALNEKMQFLMEQISFMEIDGTIVFFNEAEAVCDLDAPEPDDLELKMPKEKKQPEKKAADIASLPVNRIDHYMSKEELTAEFGENG